MNALRHHAAWLDRHPHALPVVVAVRCGAAGMDDAPLSHEQTLEVASRAGHDLGRLIAAFLEGYARSAP